MVNIQQKLNKIYDIQPKRVNKNIMGGGQDITDPMGGGLGILPRSTPHTYICPWWNLKNLIRLCFNLDTD